METQQLISSGTRQRLMSEKRQRDAHLQSLTVSELFK